MKSDHVKGGLKEAAGKIQEKAGDLIDSPKHQAEGIEKQVEGKTQKKVGDVKDAADALTRKP